MTIPMPAVLTDDDLDLACGGDDFDSGGGGDYGAAYGDDGYSADTGGDYGGSYDSGGSDGGGYDSGASDAGGDYSDSASSDAGDSGASDASDADSGDYGASADASDYGASADTGASADGTTDASDDNPDASDSNPDANDSNADPSDSTSDPSDNTSDNTSEPTPDASEADTVDLTTEPSDATPDQPGTTEPEAPGQPSWTDPDGTLAAIQANATSGVGPGLMDFETGGNGGQAPAGPTVQTFDDGSQILTYPDGTMTATPAPADPAPRPEVNPGPSLMDIETGGNGGQPPAGPTVQVFDDGSRLTTYPDGTMTSTPALQTPTTQRFDDGSTLTIGPDGTPSATMATDDRGPLNVENGYYNNGTYYGPAPVFTGDYDADLAANREAAERWAAERLERGINTIGPEGSEQSFPFTVLDATSGPQSQYFAAVHDVQGTEAYVQAMYSGRLAEYNAALRESALYGYQMADSHGGAAAAQHAAEIWAKYGFNVSGPGAVNVPAPPSNPPPPGPGLGHGAP